MSAFTRASDFKARESGALPAGLLAHPKTTDAVPTCLKTRANEGAGDYAAVVAVLSAKWRVITCRDRLQWILQRREGVTAGAPRWANVSHCPTRDTLLCCVVEHVLGQPAACGDSCQLARTHALLRRHGAAVSETALDALRALPERIRQL